MHSKQATICANCVHINDVLLVARGRAAGISFRFRLGFYFCFSLGLCPRFNFDFACVTRPDKAMSSTEEVDADLRVPPRALAVDGYAGRCTKRAGRVPHAAYAKNSNLQGGFVLHFLLATFVALFAVFALYRSRLSLHLEDGGERQHCKVHVVHTHVPAVFTKHCSVPLVSFIRLRDVHACPAFVIAVAVLKIFEAKRRPQELS